MYSRSHPELKSQWHLPSFRLTILPAVLTCCSCCLAYHMRKGVPGSEWKGKGWFSWNVRSGFGWFILSLLIGFIAKPALMAWQLHMPMEAGDCVHMARILPYLFPMCCQLSKTWATAAKGSGRSKGSNSVMVNAWPTALKWSGRWRVSLSPEPFGDY